VSTQAAGEGRIREEIKGEGVPEAKRTKGIRTRLVIAPTLLALVALVWWADRQWGQGRFSAAVLALLSLVGIHEYVHMMRSGGFPIGRRYLLGAALVLHGGAFFFTTWESLDTELYLPILATVVLVFTMALRSLTRTRMEEGLEEMGSTLLGFVWLAWPMFFAQGLAMRNLGALLFVVVISKFGDIGAYLVGVSLGRRKLIPHVSPGKSIEGAIGGLLTSCLVGFFLWNPLVGEVHISWMGIIGLSILINLTTQIGDLVESLVKRRCRVKDSSTMLPEHGGVLDLIDSLLFSVPAFFFVFVRLT